MKEVVMNEDLFREIHSVLSQIPYGQIQPLMSKIIQGVRYLEEETDAKTDEGSE